MPDRGGPANYAGINYQNYVTALYLGRMLDLTDRCRSERVVRVGVETSNVVDDICVTFADAHREFIQAKLTLRASGKTWYALWRKFTKQLDADIDDSDRLVLALGTPGRLGETLKAITIHAAASTDADDFIRRLNSAQTSRLKKIESTLSIAPTEQEYWRHFFSRLDVHLWNQDALKRDYAPIWLPLSNTAKTVLFDCLVRFVQEGAAQRLTFTARHLRDRLRRTLSIKLTDPPNWGSGIYRRFIKDTSRIELPGTSTVREIDDAFPWPACRRFVADQRRDFDDETPRSVLGIQDDNIDISTFPMEGFDRVVLTGGPGLGKSVLTKVLSRKLVEDDLLPALIPVTSFCDTDTSLFRYLDEIVNGKHGTHIDWTRAAETDVLVLIIDGLDEVDASSRLQVLRALETFSSRFPRTPWLMTVRDAAALPLPTRATCIEVQPLDDQHIEAVFRYYRPEDETGFETFSRLLSSRPDIQRFARIPLFLALMATAPDSGEELPRSRGDILESYLHILFRPEAYKPSIEPTIDPSELRLIAQHAAAAALKGGGIGISNTLLIETIRSHDRSMAGTAVIDQLVTCGVVSRSRPGRFSFPFPIVQEYLASCDYSADDIDELLATVDAAVQRPWVQTLQFVLETVECGDEVASRILNGQDDAFSTKLRLLARCVSNGMNVSENLRKGIAVRLAPLWCHPSYKIQEQVGELIADSFCIPLVPEIKCQLGNRYLLHLGAGRVIERHNDPTLTKVVFAQMLDGDIGHFFHLYELRKPVRVMSEQAYDMLLGRVGRDLESDDVVQSVSMLMKQLDGSKIPRKALDEVINDESLPLGIRLSGLFLAPDTPASIAEPLITLGLGGLEDSNVTTAVAVLLKLKGSAIGLSTYLEIGHISDERGFEIIDAVWRVASETGIQTLFRETELRSPFSTRCLVYLAAAGDASTMAELADMAGLLSVETLGATIKVLGNYRREDLAGAIADSLKGRTLSPTERVRLMGDICIGMTTRYEMVGWHSGSLHMVPLHPGLGRFLPILHAWSLLDDYHAKDALVLDTQLAEIGDENATRRLGGRIAAVLDSAEIDSKDEIISSDIGRALSVMTSRRISVKYALVFRVLKETGFNSRSAAYGTIAAQGTEAALAQLLEGHNNATDFHVQGMLLDLIETLATRFGTTIFVNNGKLNAAWPSGVQPESSA